MTKVDLRVRKSQLAIEQAFVSLVTEVGFEQVTVKSLCAQAMVGRSTFYHYYQDKYDLLRCLVNHYGNQFDNLLRRRLTAPRLDGLLRDLYQDLATHQRSLLTLLDLHDPAGDLQQRLTTSLERQLMPILQTLTSPVSAEFLTTLYAANVLTALKWALRHGDVGPVTTFMNHLFNTLRQNDTVQ